ncbi:uncharacterized protein LOC114880377 [Osmia bicornis bicornis]|uniref:uncharacterized protein LOC114880377 n=1 Tax=Osmia bicornis bicornis TaxID=1437191 RepID=UPI0010F4C865|nr:uncharacterized protein LOC114880377 [Osmia bicornis bicornis]
MRIPVFVLLLGIALYARGEAIENKEEEGSFLNCVLEDNTIGCMRTRLARDIDQIEVQVTGKKSEVPMSAVIEQAGNFVAEVIDDIQNPEDAEEVEEDVENDGEQEEGRGKKMRKKKKHLQKLLGLAMLFKAKLSLLLQLISTHFQVKVFAIAFISLVINAVKFWLDLKKLHPPKVIYYEHAQHQHHYDHDDQEHGYWGRSTNDSPQDLAYSAYTKQN